MMYFRASFLLVLTISCYEQITASLPEVTRDLSSDIDYASNLVKVFSSQCESFSWYEEGYYATFINVINPEAALINDNLVALQVDEEAYSTLKLNYAKMLVDVRQIIDVQRQNLADYIVFLAQVDYDLYNNLNRLKDEDMTKLEEHFIKVQTEFNEADEEIHNINYQLFQDTSSLVNGMSGAEYDSINETLLSIKETLVSEYSSIMHMRLQFSSSKKNAENALQRVVNQI